MAFLGYGIGFWTPPFFVRFHGVDEREAGLVLGTIAGAWATAAEASRILG
jgi:hypothetical protein